MKLETKDLLPIGRFARVAGLTVKALRHYDEIGVLSPAHVDSWTGYRYYALAQARDAEAVRRLRSLDVPLEEIRELLVAGDDTLRDRLRAHRARIEGRAVETRRILAELQALIEGKETLVPDTQEVRLRFEMDVKDVGEQHVLTVTDHAHIDEMSTVIPRQIMEVGGYLKEIGKEPAGPPLCICPYPDEQGMLDADTGWLVDPDVPGRNRIEAKTLPAVRALVMKHVGPYDELGRSYRLMKEVMEENGLTEAGVPREIYWTDPEEVPDPKDYVTEIVWPIGPEGDFDRSRDVFTKRVER